MRPYGYFGSRAILLLLCGLLLALGGAVGAQITLPSGIVITANNTTYDNKDIIVDGKVTGTATIDGQHPFNSLTIQNGGVVTHDPPSSVNFAGGMNLIIATYCTITIGSSINAAGMGWPGGAGSFPAQGPGAGGSDASGSNGGGGGAYGGEALGGSGGAAGLVYDDLTLKAPMDLGSGGGSGGGGAHAGGNGGGVIQMNVIGTLTVNGQIVADGAPGNNAGNDGGGAGSGGSINLTVGTLNGSGFISATGGSTGYDDNGSGGGGRIAISYYTANSFAAPPPATTGYQIRAAGGYSSQYGYAGAGTVFLQHIGPQMQGDLWVHNQGNSEPWNACTPIQDPLTFDNVYVWGKGVLTAPPGSPLMLIVLSNVTVAVDGQISVYARGYSGGFGPFPAQGPGAGGSDTGGGSGGGGAYGGEALPGNGGGAGIPYDDLTLKMPADLGSGGGSGSRGANSGGNGGGAILMMIGGTLQVDGSISADGQSPINQSPINGYGGGGSGGSIYLMVGTMKTMSGTGFISASGGSGYTSYCGAGSGGRVAIDYSANSFATPLSTSAYAIRAAGGYSPYPFDSYAGAGTVFLQQVGQGQGDLWINNAGNSEGANAYTPLEDPLTFDDVYIWGQGVLASPYGASLTLQVLGTLDVGVNGFLSAAGRGYAGASGSGPASGPGAGVSDTSGHYGGGGGYGGIGDADQNGYNAGGPTYGSASMPTDLGSGGGSGQDGANVGGSGGGAIHAIVNGTLQVDGTILADGQGGAGGDGGGGSGGSLWLVTNTLSGAGLISAQGGGSGQGGGGGGGRIAIYVAAKHFASGTIRAPGGGDNQRHGSAGTIKVVATSGVLLQTISLAPTTVAEGQGTIGSVTLSGPAPVGGVTIALTNSNPAVAFVPPSVTVLAGQQGATFPITANALGAAANVTISASLGGIVQTATLSVNTWIGSVTLNPAAVPGGASSTGTVTLNFPAPQGGLPITLASSSTSLATVTGSVTVPQGKTSVTFSISTSGSVVSETPVTISAAYSPESFSTTLYVDPSSEALKAFVLTPTIVVGGYVTVATVSLTGKAPAGGAVVALASANPGLVSVPATVTIPAGWSHAAFIISTPQVTANQSANISATLGTVTKTVKLQVTPTGVGTLTLVPNSVQGGVETAAGIVTLQSAVQTSTTVTITSSNTTYAIPETPIVIPAGQLVGIFNIGTATNNTGKPIKVTITATANGISAKATLTVN